MTAFINGALSAFNRVLNLIKILDPEGKDENLVQMQNQILTYIEMYKALQADRENNPIKDETWEKIQKATTLNEEADIIDELIAKA